MKTRIILYILSYSILFAPSVYSQKIYERPAIQENWFVHIGVGGQTFIGNNEDKTGFQKRISPMPTVSVGKWLSPYWGVRLKGQGGLLREFDGQGAVMQKDKYYNVHLNVLWNATNQLTGYSPAKVFNFTPYAGLGFAHRFQLDDNANIPQKTGVQPDYRDGANAVSINGGFQLGFRLNRRINLDFDLGASILPDYFDRVVYLAKNEAILSATGGFTFKLGNVDFKTIEPMDYALINELNNKVNMLHIENDELSAQFIQHPLAPCPECPQAAPEIMNLTGITYVPNVVFFRLNSAKVDENQQISIFNTAEFLNENGGKIRVVGYADKSTGSQEYNLQLSEKRAKAVASELVTKYQVESQNIVVEWKGAKEQPYKENDWNRVVIMVPQH